jgi:hypothetical protein
MAAKVDNAEVQDGNTLNMTSIDSAENQRVCVELSTGKNNNLKSSVYKIAARILIRTKGTHWIVGLQ